jgi:hypothetical protein
MEIKSINFLDTSEYEKDKKILLDLLSKIVIPKITKNRVDALGNITTPEREKII